MQYPFKGGWDENFYLAQATSLAYDMDYDIANDLFHTPMRVWNENPEQYSTIEFQLRASPDGHIHSQFAIGSSLLSIPAIEIARLIKIKNITHAHVARLSPATCGWLGIWSALLSGLTLYGAYLLARLCGFGKRTSAASAAICFIATPLAFWSLRAPGYSHMASAFASTAFLMSCILYHQKTGIARAGFFGLTGGLMYITRWADSILLIIGMAIWAKWLVEEWRRNRSLPRKSLLEALTGLLAFVSVGLFQWTAWRLNFGSWLTMPQGEGFIHWSRPEWGALLWRHDNAFIPWAPAAWFAIPGLVFWFRKSVWWPSLLLAVLALYFYVAAISGDVEGGWSFGSRRQTSLYPILVLSVASFIQYCRIDRSKVALGFSVLLAFTTGMFLIRLREVGVSNLIKVYTDQNYSFGHFGTASRAILFRSDLLHQFGSSVLAGKESVLISLIILLSMFLALLLIIKLLHSNYGLKNGGTIATTIIASLIIFHFLMICTNGRDDRQVRQEMAELHSAIKNNPEKATTIAKLLSGKTRYELQATVMAANANWLSKDYLNGLEILGSTIQDLGKDTFPNLTAMAIKFQQKAVQAGQIRVSRRQ